MADNAPSQINELYEPVTQKWVRGAFADWYRRYGLGITGYPLTEQFVDAETKLPTQYFQRVALEEVSGQIRLRLLGQESLTRLQELTQQRAETQRLAADVEQLRVQLAAASQLAAVEAGRGVAAAADAALLAQLRQREEELAEAQVHLAKMERDFEASAGRVAALEGQLSQQSKTLTAQQAEIARLRAQLQQGGGASGGAVAQPAITDIVDQLMQHPTKRYGKRQRKAITHLCIHHSAVAATVPVEHVAQYHVEDQNWPGIGYHFYVKPSGVIYQTQQLETISWHVSHNNDYSVGICVAGDFTYAPPPQLQIDSAAHLVAWLMQELGIPEQNILGHKEFPANDTSCPGETWLKRMIWKNLLLESVRAVAGGQAGAGKALSHYLLFWQQPDAWAQQDWQAAERYIGRFRPTAGFSVDDAQQAEFVTIVGGDAGVSYAAEQRLAAAGSRVERIAGVDFADTKRILDQMAANGQRFLNLK
jgi:hypothetical protein